MPCRSAWVLRPAGQNHVTRKPPKNRQRLPSSMPLSVRWSTAVRRRVLFFVMVFLVAAGVRLLTFNFLSAHLNDPAWFQSGSYRVFDKRANDIVDGKGSLFWIDDPARTDLVQYPPAYPWMIAAIYKVSG